MRLTDEERHKLGWVLAVRGAAFVEAASRISQALILCAERGEDVAEELGKTMRAWLRERVCDEVSESAAKLEAKKISDQVAAERLASRTL